ncbi:MAG: helix-turn-helix transcriptional regulator [Casimicrobiaceae bacterium]
MDTREIAAYLRLKERRIYDLVRKGAIPHVRATGKLLFPRRQVDAWLAARSGGTPTAAVPTAPQVIAGSHDPLLEWAARESASGFAILACGSRGGVERLARGEATVAAVHWRDEASGEDNVPLVRSALSSNDVVMLEWARRAQGLLLARDNPLRIRSLRDMVKKRARVVLRQPEAGSHRLLDHLLHAAGLDAGALNALARPARAETDLAAAIADGRADAGLAIEAAARAHNLAFIPLAVERLDLVVRRRDAFEPALQTLLAFARTPEFARGAAALRGYEVRMTGRVVYNG